MLLQLRSLFLGDTQAVPFGGTLDLSTLEIGGEYPLKQPVSVSGRVENRTGIVTLTGEAIYLLETACSRCAAPLQIPGRLPLDHVLVDSLHSEERDDLLLVENGELLLDELVEADLILSLPMRFLCREDCRGLCARCGKNLNEGPCSCSDRQVDPRLAALQSLLDD